MSADGNADPALQTAAGKPGGRARLSATIRSNRRRFLIMGAVPVLLLLVGGYLWFSGGRYVSTDNAYVQQNRVTVNPDVAGRILEVSVHENQHVAAGDLLFRLDPETYKVALAGADAALASARIQVEQLRAAYQQAVAANQAARDNVDFKQKAFDRQQGLLDKGVTSQSSYDTAQIDLRTAQQTLTSSEQSVAAARAALGGNPDIATDRHPGVLAAEAHRDQAALDLKSTEVRSPDTGVVSQSDRMQVGEFVSTAVPVLTLVKTGDSWIEANFKETDLTHMKVGEPATVKFDAYPGHRFNAVVDSIGAGTGAEFSVLPAQNATGNWIKVVQRVPIRIRITDASADLPLRTGLSASVTVDTKSGPGTAAAAEK